MAIDWRPTAPTIVLTAVLDNTQIELEPPNAQRANSGKHRRRLSTVAPRFARRGNTVYFATQVKSAATRARTASSAPPRARPRWPRATRARLENQETARHPWCLPHTALAVTQGPTRTSLLRQSAWFAPSAPRPQKQVNPSASRAFLGPSSSLESARCALLALTPACQPRRVRAARPESTSTPSNRRRAFRVRLELTVLKQNRPTTPPA